MLRVPSLQIGGQNLKSSFLSNHTCSSHSHSVSTGELAHDSNLVGEGVASSTLGGGGGGGGGGGDGGTFIHEVEGQR